MLDITAIMQRVDTLLEENKGTEAETLMKGSIVQAVKEEDDNALLSLLNELIGYYRETSQVEASFLLADQAKALLSQMGLEGSVAHATTLLNIANAYRAGGRLKDSEECYQKAKAVYGKLLSPDDMLVASLYNNMSLLSQEMGDFAEAKERLLKALAIVSLHEEAYFELAVTYANLAATSLHLNEDEEAADYFNKAIAIFEAHGIEDAHYSAAVASLGTYYYKKGDYGKSAESFRKAMECVRRSLGENEHFHRLQENLALCERMLTEENKLQESEQQANNELQEKDGKRLTGLALCREYYETYGVPMIREQFPEYEDKIAVGLVGEGSDCFGYDDEISRDHDWGPGFCMWVTEAVWQEIGKQLQDAYEKLPKQFKGYIRAVSKQGQGRMGVQTVNGFYDRLLGGRDWQQMSDAALSASVNGEVFRDDEGIFSAVRKELLAGYPENIVYLKLAESAARFSQTGQYNYARVLKRGDIVTAQMMLGDWLKEAMKLCYYMENRYPPHEKWLFKGLKALGGYEEVCKLIEQALQEKTENAYSDLQGVSAEGIQARKIAIKNAEKQQKMDLIENIASILANKLYEKGYISDTESYLDAHTEELLMKSQLSLKSNEELVEEIARLEFTTFDKVCNIGGRADCQDDWDTFSIMRKSQYLTWDRPMLLQYLYDFHREVARGHNLITEKYGRMMESTAPSEYEEIKENFQALSEEKKAIIEAIVQLQVGWMEAFEKEYSALAGNARSVHTTEDNLYNTSYETYLRGEISTYSDKMLELYGRYVVRYAREGKNLTYDIMTNSVLMYGYKGLKEAEEQMSRL